MDGWKTILSFWVPVSFQGRTVKLLGISDVKRGYTTQKGLVAYVNPEANTWQISSFQASSRIFRWHSCQGKIGQFGEAQHHASQYHAISILRISFYMHIYIYTYVLHFLSAPQDIYIDVPSPRQTSPREKMMVLWVLDDDDDHDDDDDDHDDDDADDDDVVFFFFALGMMHTPLQFDLAVINNDWTLGKNDYCTWSWKSSNVHVPCYAPES